MIDQTYQTPYHCLEGDEQRGLVLVADHAMRLLPQSYGDLGLPEAAFERHIAYDIGIEALTRGLSKALNAPAIMAGYSRLLIDPNRDVRDPTLIRQLYDRHVIDGNYPLSDDERQNRIDTYYRPYHQAVSALIKQVEQASQHPPLVVSLHSFTPNMKGLDRPWHIGILSSDDRRASDHLLEMLYLESDLIVGDNEPYKGSLPGDCMDQHCVQKGLSHTLIELRQDLIREPSGQAEWINRLAPMIETLNQNPQNHELFQGLS